MSSPMTKSEREKCWNARDLLWNCMDEKQERHQELCKEFRAQYEKSCPGQWVKHFDRKREYLKFKDQINNEGHHDAIRTGNGYLGIQNSPSPTPSSDDEMKYGNSLTVACPTQTSRSTSSVPDDLNTKCSPSASRLSPVGHPSTVRVIRKFPSLSSI